METNNKNIKAFGLLESIIAIGVFGVTIVVGLSLIVKSLAIIKDNQVSDQATSFMFTSLEYVRSPLVKPEDLSQGSFYQVNLGPNGQVTGVTNMPSALAIEANDSCNPTTNDFFVDVDGPDSSGIFCNQITVGYVNSGDSTSDYVIKSIGVYKVRDGYKYSEAVGYKSRTQP